MVSKEVQSFLQTVLKSMFLIFEPQESILYAKMTIIKTKIFIYNSDLYRAGKGPRWWFKNGHRIRYQPSYYNKWIIVSEITTDLWKVNILPQTLILVF